MEESHLSNTGSHNIARTSPSLSFRADSGVYLSSATSLTSGVSSSSHSPETKSGSAGAAGLALLSAEIHWHISYKDLAESFEQDVYRNLKTFGEGSFGLVCKSKLCNQDVAVKLFKSEDLLVPANRQVFVREVQVQYELRHPNLVRMYGASAVFDGANKPFIAFEFLFRTLNAALYIPEERLSELDGYEGIVRVAREIASGLAYLHHRYVGVDGTPRKSIVHHDIKPHNIMLTHGLRAKLIDFGLADTINTLSNSAAQGGQTIGLGGTLGYMGPESLRVVGSKDSTSHLTDVFAYGMVLYELATKQKPWHHIEKRAIATYIKLGKLPEFPSKWEEDQDMEALVKIMQACWQQEVKKRPEMTVVVACLRICEGNGNLNDVQALLDPDSAVDSEVRSP